MKYYISNFETNLRLGNTNRFDIFHVKRSMATPNTTIYPTIKDCIESILKALFPYYDLNIVLEMKFTGEIYIKNKNQKVYKGTLKEFSDIISENLKSRLFIIFYRENGKILKEIYLTHHK